MSRPLLLGAGPFVACLLATHAAASLVLVPSASVVTQIRTLASGTVDSCDTSTDQTLVCGSSFGGPTSAFEGRSAARVVGGAIAANAQFTGRQTFPTQDFEASGQAILQVGIQNLTAIDQPLDITFLIPPSFLEFTDNSELPAIQSMHLLADLSVSFLDRGTSRDLVQFEVVLSGDFFDVPVGNSLLTYRNLFSDVGVDVSPLANPTLTVTPGTAPSGVPNKTVLYEFPALGASVSLGSLLPGESARLDYLLQAIVVGSAATESVAIAAINDPLSVSGSLLTISGQQVVVPEPGLPVLLVVVALGLAGLRSSAGRPPRHRPSATRARPLS